MGKIRTKLIGAEDVEKEQAEKAKARREVKKALRQAQGEPLKSKKEPVKEVEKEKKTLVEEGEKVSVKKAKKTKATTEDDGETMQEEDQKKGKKETIKEKKATAIVTPHGKKYIASKKMVDEKKQYSVTDAVKLIKKMKYAAFDETVELHLNVIENNLKGEVTLPAGTGKEIRVAIADDDVIAKIESGKIDFDVLIAAPQTMSKLIKFAKLLGPKGLMPNLKAGTVSDKPEEAAKKFTGGSIHFKTEAKFPLIHQSVGKMSFSDEDLVANIQALLKAVGAKNITAAFVSASMTPSVWLKID